MPTPPKTNKLHYARLVPFSEGNTLQQPVISEKDVQGRSQASSQIALQDTRVTDVATVTVGAVSAVNTAPLPFNPVAVDFLALDRQPTMIVPVVPLSDSQVKSAGNSEGERNIRSLIGNLVKSSGVYAISSLATPLISLVLAPFLTQHMTYANYGALAVLNTAIALLAGMTQLGLSSAFFRAYNLDYETPQDRSSVLSATLLLLLFVTVPVAAAINLAAPWITFLLLKSSDPVLVNSVRLLGVIVLLQNLTVPGFAWLRAENRVAFFATLAIANLALALVANLVLVGLLHMGIQGSLLATAAGYCAIILCTLPAVLKHGGLHLRRDIAKSMLAFGVPNVFNLVAVWVLQLADRSLLAHLGSLSQTASYSIAYSLGGVLGVAVLSPFQLAWPTVLFTIAKRDDAARVFQLVFRWYSIVLLFATYALSLVALAALNILFPIGYRPAGTIIPIIALSIMFFGIYNYTNVGLSVRRKTWIAPLLTAIGAVINVGCNIVLIPIYGLMGAAIATFIAYAMLAVLGFAVNQRVYPIPFEIARFMLALAIGVLLFVGGSLLLHTALWYVTWGVHLVMLCLYAGCLLIIGKFPVRRAIDGDGNTLRAKSADMRWRPGGQGNALPRQYREETQW